MTGFTWYPWAMCGDADRSDADCMSLVDALASLDPAAADGTLELLFQPEVDLRTGEILAMEALLRWHARELGVLAPPAFLDAAERVGQLGAIGEWVLREGVREAARWQSLPGRRRQLRLNVATGQLRDRTLPGQVARLVAEYRLPLFSVALEVSEQSLRELGADAGPVLHDLRAAGVGLAIDNLSFFATLGAIDTLPVDVVKLGHQYVRGVDVEADVRMLTTVLAHAHQRGLVVVAEGVQTWGEASRLTELGCDRAHGWLYASPQRADKARWLLTQGSSWRGAPVTPDVTAVPFLPSPRAEIDVPS